MFSFLRVSALEYRGLARATASEASGVRDGTGSRAGMN